MMNTIENAGVLPLQLVVGKRATSVNGRRFVELGEDTDDLEAARLANGAVDEMRLLASRCPGDGADLDQAVVGDVG